MKWKDGPVLKSELTVGRWALGIASKDDSSKYQWWVRADGCPASASGFVNTIVEAKAAAEDAYKKLSKAFGP